jgi:4-hydroxythreonine-4-phosphate dehydrogenase
VNATGPIAADTLFVRAIAGEFDAVVAMYHDQGHVALKTIGFNHAVNVTLGLPIVRTSVAHGTAYDIAWKGRAETSSLIEAVRVAARIVAGRRSLPRVGGG